MMGGGGRRLLQGVLALLILGLGGLGFSLLKAGRKPVARRAREAARTWVRVVEVGSDTVSMVVESEGTVRPARESVLSAEVGGRVSYVSPSLVDGAAVSADELLVRIEPADYALQVTLREAEVVEAEKNLELAREEAAAARDEWVRLRGGDPPPLVAKQPQLAAAEAGLRAARARLGQARRNLERTEIRAPFAGLITEKSVDLGQYLPPGSPIARLLGTEAAEVRVFLEGDDLQWISVPGFTAEGEGSSAAVRVELAGETREWPGRVARAGAGIDERTRLIPLVVQVEKPYASQPPLAFGSFAAVSIEGREVAGVSLLPPASVRPGGVVWVVDEEDRLRRKRVEVLRRLGERLVVRPGFPSGTRVVLTPPATATEGMLVEPELVSFPEGTAATYGVEGTNVRPEGRVADASAGGSRRGRDRIREGRS
jgi:RND family efflux transporter MFP subunit